MNPSNRYGWWAFAGLLAVNVLVATLRPADAQLQQDPRGGPEPSGRAPADRRGRCVAVAACTAGDGMPLVFRAFEDGTVEERRAEGIRNGKPVYTWKPALHPGIDVLTKP